jgi:hypothetical protein
VDTCIVMENDVGVENEDLAGAACVRHMNSR